MKHTSYITLFILFLCGNALAQNEYEGWHTNFDAASRESKNSGKPVLLVFSGSDWCKPCIKLARGTFSSEAFKAFSKDSLVMVNLDFPVAKAKQPNKEEQQARNAVADIYNPDGSFPSVVVLTPEGTVLGKTGYKNVSPRGYIDHLKSFLSKYNYPTEEEYRLQGEFLLMGSKFEIAAISEDSTLARNVVRLAKDEIVRIEALISSWDAHSETFEINTNAGIKKTKVSPELYELIRRSLKLSVLTEGAFDISFASINSIWKFDRTEVTMPTKSELEESVAKINYKNILLDPSDSTIFLKEKGMRIGFGAIGKGYAANKAKELMFSMGIDNGMVNAGGDLIAWGEGFEEETWRIGIADPNKQKGVVSWIEINDMAVVTSGDYERYALIDGKKYSHIIDPRTGMPAGELKSVTIICKDAEIADGLATSVSVIGSEAGLKLINEMPGVECILILDNDQIKSSENISLGYQTKK